MKWIYLKVDETPIRSLSSELFDETFTQVGYELETNPHITLVPKYKMSGDVDLPDVSGEYVDVSGYRFYPSEEKPMVVMLDVSNDQDIYHWRHYLVNGIGRENIQYNLHPPHITLFKAGDSGDENKVSIDDGLRSCIMDNIHNTEPPRKVRVKDIIKADWNDY